MPPLGPFNGKSFGTTISPWIVTLEALDSFRLPVSGREPRAADYLTSEGDQAHYSMTLQVEMVDGLGDAAKIGTSRLEWLYWTFRDMVAHYTVNGCALRPGDLLATGTVSGSQADSHGCLMEITRGGKQTVSVGSFGERTYLEDGDTIRLSGWAGEPGSESCVGFGDCVGSILPAIEWKGRHNT